MGPRQTAHRRNKKRELPTAVQISDRSPPTPERRRGKIRQGNYDHRENSRIFNERCNKLWPQYK